MWFGMLTEKYLSHTRSLFPTGEMISEPVAQKRAVAYDNSYGGSYLMDFWEGDEAEDGMSVDAFKFGNVARFINHGYGDLFLANCRVSNPIDLVWEDEQRDRHLGIVMHPPTHM